MCVLNLGLSLVLHLRVQVCQAARHFYFVCESYILCVNFVFLNVVCQFCILCVDFVFVHVLYFEFCISQRRDNPPPASISSRRKESAAGESSSSQLSVLQCGQYCNVVSIAMWSVLQCGFRLQCGQTCFLDYLQLPERRTWDEPF